MTVTFALQSSAIYSNMMKFGMSLQNESFVENKAEKLKIFIKAEIVGVIRTVCRVYHVQCVL